jgi:hypothetical protein
MMLLLVVLSLVLGSAVMTVIMLMMFSGIRDDRAGGEAVRETAPRTISPIEPTPEANAKARPELESQVTPERERESPLVSEPESQTAIEETPGESADEPGNEPGDQSADESPSPIESDESATPLDELESRMLRNRQGLCARDLDETSLGSGPRWRNAVG